MKQFFTICICFLCLVLLASLSFAGSGKKKVIARKNAGGVTPLWGDSFNRANTNDPDTGGYWDSEVDEDSGDTALVIYSNQLRFSADTSGEDGYVKKDGSWAVGEFTIKTTVKFSYKTSISDAAVRNLNHTMLYDSGGEATTDRLFKFVFYTNSSGNLSKMEGTAYNDENSGLWLQNDIDLSGSNFDADTEYPLEFYFKKEVSDGSGDGIACMAIKDDSETWQCDCRSDIGNFVQGILDKIHFGGTDNFWGSGTNDCMVDSQEIYLYSGDQRSGWGTCS